MKTLANAKIIALLAVIASGVGSLVTYQARKWSAEHAKEAERAAIIRAVCGTWTGERRGTCGWKYAENVYNESYTMQIRSDGTVTIKATTVLTGGMPGTPWNNIEETKTWASNWSYSQGQLYVMGDQFAVSGGTMTCVAGRNVAGICDHAIRFSNPLVMTRQSASPGIQLGSTGNPLSGAAAAAPAAPSPSVSAPAKPQGKGKVDFSGVEKLLGD